MRVGVLTTFTGMDRAYSLVNVVHVQLKMLHENGYLPVLYSAEELAGWPGVELRRLAKNAATADEIYSSMIGQFDDVRVVFCHDIVFLAQHRQWADALRRFAAENPQVTWLHWQHSRGDHNPIEPVPNSHFCYPNNGDLHHVARLNRTTIDRVHYVPHPLDFDYLKWPELAIRIAEETELPFVDVAMLYPSRLDRQKQVERSVRIFAGLKRLGLSVRLLVADSFATGDRFLNYKDDLRAIAEGEGLTDEELIFLSERYEECHTSTDRDVVKALLEMCNLFIQTSNAETSSLVVMEAALAGNLCVINADFKPIHHLYKAALALPFGAVTDTQPIEYYRHIQRADGTLQKVLDPQQFWDDQARITVLPTLKSQMTIELKRQQFIDRWPSKVFSEHIEPLIKMVTKSTDLPTGDPEVTAIVTTLDNLPLLKRQVPILKLECGRVIIVNNGAEDGTREWLDEQEGLETIHRENLGAGPGRNAGLNLWNDQTPYVLMVDGGILPLIGGVAAMKAYLQRHEDVSVIAPEVGNERASCFTKDEAQASQRFDVIDDSFCFPQTCLSSTAYCLTTRRAWDGIRLNEDGPFGEPGWGVDDNELQYRWNEAGILHHDFTAQMGVKLYRRASGSFATLFKKTGIWPSQYGSVFEKRNVWCFQNVPDHRMLFKWPRNVEKSYIIRGLEIPYLAQQIKAIHDNGPGPYEIIVMTEGLSQPTLDWIETHRLRWQWGDTAITPAGEIVRKNGQEDTWTGNFLVDAEPNGEPAHIQPASSSTTLPPIEKVADYAGYERLVTDEHQ